MSYTCIKSAIITRVVCRCDAYPYPHKAQAGDCKVSLIDNPPLPERSKRGKIVKLYDKLDDLENLLIDCGFEVFLESVRELRSLLDS